jgi:hypothetical protein
MSIARKKNKEKKKKKKKKKKIVLFWQFDIDYSDTLQIHRLLS